MKDIVVSPLPTLDCLNLYQLLDLAFTPSSALTSSFFEKEDNLVVSLDTVRELLTFYLLGHPGQTRQEIMRAFIPSLRGTVGRCLEEKVIQGSISATKEDGRLVYRCKMPPLDELAKKIRGE